MLSRHSRSVHVPRIGKDSTNTYTEYRKIHDLESSYTWTCNDNFCGLFFSGIRLIMWADHAIGHGRRLRVLDREQRRHCDRVRPASYHASGETERNTISRVYDIRRKRTREKVGGTASQIEIYTLKRNVYFFVFIFLHVGRSKHCNDILLSLLHRTKIITHYGENAADRWVKSVSN